PSSMSAYPPPSPTKVSKQPSPHAVTSPAYPSLCSPSTSNSSTPANCSPTTPAVSATSSRTVSSTSANSSKPSNAWPQAAPPWTPPSSPNSWHARTKAAPWPNSPHANAKSWPKWPKAAPTPPSPNASTSLTKPSASTSTTSSPNSTYRPPPTTAAESWQSWPTSTAPSPESTPPHKDQHPQHRTQPTRSPHEVLFLQACLHRPTALPGVGPRHHLRHRNIGPTLALLRHRNTAPTIPLLDQLLLDLAILRHAHHQLRNPITKIVTVALPGVKRPAIRRHQVTEITVRCDRRNGGGSQRSGLDRRGMVAPLLQPVIGQ